MIAKFGLTARGLMMHNYQNPLVVIQAIGLFLFFSQKIKGQSASWLKALINCLVKYSFEIYLYHQLLIDLLY
jgi:surface polysaccharide O-acyltransferase-like enzyme